MVRVAVFLLILIFDISASTWAADVCIINSYPIPPARRLEHRVRELLKEHHHKIVTSGCNVKVLIGTPAVVKELNANDNCKRVYTFILFPEKLGLQNRENFYGVRIFPLPERTYKRFLKKLCLRKGKVAVPISKEMLPIAEFYLKKTYFVPIPFKNSPVETFKKLLSYKYVYIFPDPKLLKLINLVTLINFCKDNKLIIFSGLSDLYKFNLDYVDEIDFEKLAEDMVFLVENNPKNKILPCPCKEE